MSKPIDIVVQSTRELLANQIKILNSLLDMKDSSTLELYLNSTFSTLLAALVIADDRSLATYLDRTKQEKFVKCCIRVIDHKQKLIGRVRIYAIRILSILVQQLSNQPNTRTTLKLVYTSLVEKLQPPRDQISPDDVKLKGFTAQCLNQIELKQILSPLEAYNLIEDSVMPLAAWLLANETKQDKNSFPVLLTHYGRSHRTDDDRMLMTDSSYSYPSVIRLLVSLSKHTESGPTKSYRKELDSMLKSAIKTGVIKDEHMVALNVILNQDGPKKLTNDHLRLAINLMAKSEGHHRACSAFTAQLILIPHKISTNLGLASTNFDSKYKTILTTMMFDDLTTKNDKLLAEAALYSLWSLEDDELDWRSFVKGKEISITRKLVEMDPRPEFYKVFLRHFDCFQDSNASIEFDGLTRALILQNINKLDELISLETRDKEQVQQLRESMRCLAHLLRLRRHRLELAEEVKLNELIELLVDNKISADESDALILFFFANSYQVHASAWNTTLKLLRLPEQDPLGPGVIRSTFIENPATTQRVLSHFLMLDGDRFYREFGSMEVLELILANCKNAIGWNFHKKEDRFETLFRELLLTYPGDYRSTKLNPRGYQIIKTKLIASLMSALAIKTAHLCLVDESERLVYWRGVKVDKLKEYVNLSSCLVVVLSRHRETLEVFAEDFNYARDLWLRENISDWSRLIMKHEDYPNDVLLGSFPPIGLASVMAAKELYDCREFRVSPSALLKFIKSSCDQGIQRAPVDSIMSRRYQQIKDSLPGA